MPNQTELPNPILQVTQERNGVEYIGKFGADAEHIKIELKDNSNNVILACNLLDFFKNWEDFKANNAFMYHGENRNLSDQVKFWYDTSMNPYFIIKQPENIEIQTIGDPLVFSIDTNDEAATYQWQRKRTEAEGWSNATGTGNKSKTLSFNSASEQTTWIGWRCVVNFSNGTEEISNEAHVIWPN